MGVGDSDTVTIDEAFWDFAASTSAAQTDEYAIDGQMPSVAIRARSLTDLEQALARAAARDLSAIPVGGRTMLELGMPPSRYDVALDLSEMREVVDYEPDDFTITVQAGMPLAALQRALASNGQLLPLDHPRFERATVGGICSVGRGGLRRNAFGGPRDWLIGMRIVRADGTTIKGGGKVVKNVSGYDLPKLFAGSLGTLGVIAETTFKLRPQPASDQVVALEAETFAHALAAARSAASAAPFLNGCLALSAEMTDRARAHGADIRAARPALVLRAIGLESAASEVLATAIRAARSDDAIGAALRTDAIVETWQAITDLELSTAPDHVRLRVGLPPGHLEHAWSLLDKRLPGANCWLAAADSGLLFVEHPSVDAEAIAGLRDALAPLRGRLTIESAPPALKHSGDVWGASGTGARLMHNIKRQFDPKRTLNPGRYVDGI